MELKNIYKSVEMDMSGVEQCIALTLKKTDNASIREIGDYLFASPGKRIRPALTLMSAKAVMSHLNSLRGSNHPKVNAKLIEVAAAVELIHMASVTHDDVIDRSEIRHNKPTINIKNGADVAITLGDFLYSKAYDIISQCGNIKVIQCISSATKTMCEGELLQVCERDNVSILKDRYIDIIEKKTSSLFAAACQSGALICGFQDKFCNALMDYGVNFGMAFQIVDDYLDIVATPKDLGKKPGQDIEVGEVTLPMMHIIESLPVKEREDFKVLLLNRSDKLSIDEMRSKLINSDAADKTKKVAEGYMNKAKEKISIFSDSPYKKSLLQMSDFIIRRGFNNKSTPVNN